MSVGAMLRHSRKRMKQRQNKPLAKHANETLAPIVDRLVTVENDPTVPTYARKVAADAVRAMEGES